MKKKKDVCYKSFEVAKSLARLIDSAPPQPAPLVLFRGISEKAESEGKKVSELKIGDTYYEYGFSSKK